MTRSTTTLDEPAIYSEWVERVAVAIHEDCLLEWQAAAVVDPKRQVTMHMADAHYGMAHDLVRRLSLAAQPPPPAEALRLLLDRLQTRVSRALSTHALEHESTEAERGLIDFIRESVGTILDDEARRFLSEKGADS